MGLGVGVALIPCVVQLALLSENFPVQRPHSLDVGIRGIVVWWYVLPPLRGQPETKVQDKALVLLVVPGGQAQCPLYVRGTEHRHIRASQGADADEALCNELVVVGGAALVLYHYLVRYGILEARIYLLPAPELLGPGQNRLVELYGWKLHGAHIGLIALDQLAPSEVSIAQVSATGVDGEEGASAHPVGGKSEHVPRMSAPQALAAGVVAGPLFALYLEKSMSVVLLSGVAGLAAGVAAVLKFGDLGIHLFGGPPDMNKGRVQVLVCSAGAGLLAAHLL
jgi:hypothetical protein